ncbi:sulfotransferase 2B1-like isoform X2 [Ascaphus truei]|uniref:sulfotransferase 2B1-like isoform X2 n=1 Tax=Ascaphus truei TaxID=8439 RepID=UPI003F5ACB55
MHLKTSWFIRPHPLIQQLTEVYSCQCSRFNIPANTTHAKGIKRLTKDRKCRLSTSFIKGSILLLAYTLRRTSILQRINSRCWMMMFTMLPTQNQIIYTMRNPKDVFVSLFYFAKILPLYKNSENFQLFLENFLQGDVLYGSWFDHVKGWMQMKDNRNVFFITYEELQQDLRGSVVKICEFLGKELDDAAIDLVVKHSSFQSMKENKMSNYTLLPQHVLDHKKGSWLRKGISGDWKNHFTVAQSEYFDRVYQEKMKDLNMKFFWDK